MERLQQNLRWLTALTLYQMVLLGAYSIIQYIDRQRIRSLEAQVGACEQTGTEGTQGVAP